MESIRGLSSVKPTINRPQAWFFQSKIVVLVCGISLLVLLVGRWLFTIARNKNMKRQQYIDPIRIRHFPNNLQKVAIIQIRIYVKTQMLLRELIYKGRIFTFAPLTPTSLKRFHLNTQLLNKGRNLPNDLTINELWMLCISYAQQNYNQSSKRDRNLKTVVTLIQSNPSVFPVSKDVLMRWFPASCK